MTVTEHSEYSVDLHRLANLDTKGCIQGAFSEEAFLADHVSA